MATEQWRDVIGYEGRYQVNNLGIVRSIIEKKCVVLRPQIDRRGYAYVNLYLNRKMKSVKLHRIVAKAFLENPDNLPQVNHKDFNQLNNAVTNLEWCSPSHNIKHAMNGGRYSMELLQSPIIRNKAIKTRSMNDFTERGKRPVLDTQTGIFYPSVTEAAIAKGIIRCNLFDKLTRYSHRNDTGFVLI